MNNIGCTWLVSNGIFFSVALGRWQQTWRGCRVELLDLLNSNLPESTGGAEGWNLHKVREIVLFRW